MKSCPRCHRQTLHDEKDLNCLSHRDSRTFICEACGDEETAIDRHELPETVNELAFYRYLKELWEH